MSEGMRCVEEEDATLLVFSGDHRSAPESSDSRCLQ